MHLENRKHSSLSNLCRLLQFWLSAYPQSISHSLALFCLHLNPHSSNWFPLSWVIPLYHLLVSVTSLLHRTHFIYTHWHTCVSRLLHLYMQMTFRWSGFYIFFVLSTYCYVVLLPFIHTGLIPTPPSPRCAEVSPGCVGAGGLAGSKLCPLP